MNPTALRELRRGIIEGMVAHNWAYSNDIDLVYDDPSDYGEVIGALIADGHVYHSSRGGGLHVHGLNLERMKRNLRLAERLCSMGELDDGGVTHWKLPERGGDLYVPPTPDAVGHGWVTWGLGHGETLELHEWAYADGLFSEGVKDPNGPRQKIPDKLFEDGQWAFVHRGSHLRMNVDINGRRGEMSADATALNQLRDGIRDSLLTYEIELAKQQLKLVDAVKSVLNGGGDEPYSWDVPDRHSYIGEGPGRVEFGFNRSGELEMKRVSHEKYDYMDHDEPDPAKIRFRNDQSLVVRVEFSCGKAILGDSTLGLKLLDAARDGGRAKIERLRERRGRYEQLMERGGRFD